jgi:histidinol phosphatase-like PHP family hydrolase
MENPEYVGDSVYMAKEQGALVIYTDNGYGPENVIYLDPGVAKAVDRYIKKQEFMAEREG